MDLPGPSSTGHYLIDRPAGPSRKTGVTDSRGNLGEPGRSVAAALLPGSDVHSLTLSPRFTWNRPRRPCGGERENLPSEDCAADRVSREARHCQRRRL